MLWGDVSFATHSSGLYMTKASYYTCTRRKSTCLKLLLKCKSTSELYRMLNRGLNAVTNQGLNSKFYVKSKSVAIVVCSVTDYMAQLFTVISPTSFYMNIGVTINSPLAITILSWCSIFIFV